jgi:hypothetical protein
MKRAFVAIVVMGLAYGAWGWWTSGPEDDELERGEDPALIRDYLWADRDLEELPPTEFAHLFALTEDERQRQVGGVLKASHFDFHLRLFAYRLDGNRVRLKFPQDGKQADFRFRISRCGKTMCLEMKSSPWGPKKYVAVGEIQRGRGMEQLETVWRQASRSVP